MSTARALRHLIGLTLAGVGLQALLTLEWYLRSGQTWGEGLLGLAPGVPALVFGTLPATAAVTVAMMFIENPRASRAMAIKIALVAVAAMVVVDVVSPSATVARTSVAVIRQSGQADADVRYYDLGRVSIVRTAGAVASGDRGHLERSNGYSGDHPRVGVSFALLKTGALAMPVLLAMIVWMSLSWMRREVRFVQPGRQALVSLGLAWGVGIGIYYTVMQMSERLRISSLVADGVLPSILAPQVVMGAVVVVLWSRAAVVEEVEVELT